MAERNSTLTTVEPVIIVHGGAWAIPDDLAEQSVLGVTKAVRLGYQLLASGRPAIDAVEAAVSSLEDDPAFDAGTGSVLNSGGKIEMDAMIMDGKSLQTGAVTCVENIKHPVKLARLVMEKTEHVLIAGTGANKFAEEVGVETVPMESLVSEEALREYQCYKNYNSTVADAFRLRVPGHETVGAAAVDCNGQVACATSTGGINFKRPGRVGDSPIVGCGGYADSEVGAVSTTGHGEAILKVCLAKHITYLMQQGKSAQESCELALDFMKRRVQGTGGAVVVNNRGEIGKHFTTERMAWAWARSGEVHCGLNHGEDKIC